MNKKIIQQICLSFLLVLTLVCIPVTGVQAQTQKVSIKMENVRMKQVMNEIERQTKFLFGINDDVDVNRLVTVNVTNQSLQAALDQMVKGTDITYQISSSNIILSKKQAKLPVDISGTIRDINGSPIVGATIVIRGTSIGISSGSDGSFSLQIPPPAASRQLEVSYLGYETLVVDVGNRTAFDLTLQESSAEIEQVVVTALGIKRSEKAVAYNVQQVKAEDLTTVKDANFINSLTGKVAGVTINTSSSGVGGASKVILRGNKSISQSSNALYVIDGIPMYNFGGGGGTEFDSRGATESIADINPEDIESMSVLTGAAAAALYGSEAANGAVMITTKKGQAGRLKATFSSNTEFLNPFVLPDFQNRYGTGLNGQRSGSSIYSWGEKLRREARYGYTPNDYFETGHVYTNAVTVSGGTDKNQTYFSAASVNSDGIIPNNEYDKYNVSFNGGRKFNDKLEARISFSYAHTTSQGRPAQGSNDVNVLVNQINAIPRTTDINWLKNNWYAQDGTTVTQASVDEAGKTGNLYWTVNKNKNTGTVDRMFGSAVISYKPVKGLTITNNLGTDFFEEQRRQIYAWGTVGLPDGQMGNSEVGHTNIGAGRVVYQELVRITKAIEDGSFFKNPALVDAMENCRKNNSALHLAGLL